MTSDLTPTPTMPLLNPPGFTGCFVCGLDNPDGLRLPIYRDGDEAVTWIRPTLHHVGYPDRFHGGLVGLLVDEMLVYAGVCHDLWGMTARVEYRLRAPIAVDAPVEVRASLTRRTRGAFRAEVRVTTPEGLAADGAGMCVIHPDADALRDRHQG